MTVVIATCLADALSGGVGRLMLGINARIVCDGSAEMLLDSGALASVNLRVIEPVAASVELVALSWIDGREKNIEEDAVHNVDCTTALDTERFSEFTSIDVLCICDDGFDAPGGPNWLGVPKLMLAGTVDGADEALIACPLRTDERCASEPLARAATRENEETVFDASTSWGEALADGLMVGASSDLFTPTTVEPLIDFKAALLPLVKPKDEGAAVDSNADFARVGDVSGDGDTGTESFGMGIGGDAEGSIIKDSRGTVDDNEGDFKGNNMLADMSAIPKEDLKPACEAIAEEVGAIDNSGLTCFLKVDFTPDIDLGLGLGFTDFGVGSLPSDNGVGVKNDNDFVSTKTRLLDTKTFTGGSLNIE